MIGCPRYHGGLRGSAAELGSGGGGSYVDRRAHGTWGYVQYIHIVVVVVFVFVLSMSRSLSLSTCQQRALVLLYRGMQYVRPSIICSLYPRMIIVFPHAVF